MKGPIKPSVVFFNESLPDDFKQSATSKSLAQVDLLLIMGTTLKVSPFNSIPFNVRKEVPQVLINNDPKEVRGGNLYTAEGDEGRLLLEGQCDEICSELVNQLGWQA